MVDAVALLAILFAAGGGLLIHRYITDPHPGWIVSGAVVFAAAIVLASFAGTGFYASWVADELAGIFGG